MHLMYELKKVSNLRILLKSKTQIGVGRFEGLEVIPYTPYAAAKYIPHLPITPPPEPATSLPAEITEGLRDYQITDIQQLVLRNASANFSEPRTGKTPTAIRLFKAKNLKKIIIVTPAVALYQWKNEFIKWYKESAEVISPFVSADRRDRLLKSWGTEFTALIISYDSLKLVERNGKTTGMLNKIKEHKNIDGIIVDEAHRIRNHNSKQARALFMLSYIPNRHILTGTPAHGKLPDLYSLLHFLYPTIFTGYWRFIYYYFNVHKEFYGGNSFEVADTLKNQEELPQFISRISVQHKRKEVMQWLPDKDLMTVKLDLNKEQKKYIKELEEEFETGNIIVANVLTQLIRIRQIANDPKLLGLTGNSPKTEWLKQYLEEYPDKPIIVFSNFTQYLKVLSEELDIPYLIIGETSAERREMLKQKFQNREINQLFINTQAGKEALTVDRAEVAIFLDMYPPYGDIDQAENRFTATTPALKEKPHLLIHVMMDKCYDKELFELVKRRASETEIINNYKKYLKGGEAYDCHEH